MSYGSEIVESFFDWDTKTIGPYKVPVDLKPTFNGNLSETIASYRMYEELLRSDEHLAVFDINGYCIGVLSRTSLNEAAISKLRPPSDLVSWRFTTPIDAPLVLHVGYMKTYQKCLAVTEVPNHLLMDYEHNLLGTKSKMTARCMINPPYSLYKELVNVSGALAVYFDLDRQQPAFIYE